jgi:non-ribosomal peptide synthetase component E (peptide arylation enzyme)
MNKAHVTLFALLVAGAAVLGAIAVTRTTGLGSAARHTNDAALVARTKQLAAYAAKLRKEFKAKPPPVIVVHHHHGDDGSREAEGGGGGDGGGGD